MRIREFIVVEGKSDSSKIKQAVDADTIETNGSAINADTIAILRHAQEKRGIIVFTDPDYAGQRIRQIIQEQVPQCKHAFLPKESAQPKQKGKSVGIEHASIEAIRAALQHVHSQEAEQDNHDIEPVTKADLIAHRLIGQAGALERRKRLGQILHIGETNGKQLLKRLAMFRISKEQFERAVSQIDMEGKRIDG